jgi:hypothetical protein
MARLRRFCESESGNRRKALRWKAFIFFELNPLLLASRAGIG